MLYRPEHILNDLISNNVEQDEPHFRYEKSSALKPLVKRYCEASSVQA